MRVLLLSAYDAMSHRRWREGLVRSLPDMDWTVLSLPPRHFSWRHRGSALTWAVGAAEELSSRYDLLVATSMTDLASLKGLVPGLASAPTVVYFHENQFAYPDRFDRKEGANFKLTNVTSALAADRVLFNSRFNRDTFLKGARDFLATMPDCVPTGILPALGERCEVLPVPLDDRFFTQNPAVKSGPLTILWNHRWEHDKAPERFFSALLDLARRDVPFRVNVVGQNFREVPGIFEQAKSRLGKQVARWGYVEDADEYRALLASCDVAVSTAMHDFQGMAILEAVACGCLPLAPNRLAYPEFFPPEFLYPSEPDDPERESAFLFERLAELAKDPSAARRTGPPDLSLLSWSNMAGRYRALLEGTAEIEEKMQKGGC